MRGRYSPEVELCKDAATAPDVHWCGVCGAQQNLRGPVPEGHHLIIIIVIIITINYHHHYHHYHYHLPQWLEVN